MIWSQIGPGSPSSIARLRLALHFAQPVPEVVLHIGDEIGDAVGQGHLPPRGAPAELVGAASRLFELGDHPRSVLGMQDRVELGAQRDRELLHHRDEVVHGPALVDGLRPSEHLAPQVRDQRRESRLVVERAVLQLRGEQPQVTRDGEDRHVADIAQVPAIDLLDLAPFGVEVGLGEHRGDVGRDSHRVLEELHLGFGVLLRGIRHQEHRVGGGQGRKGRECVRGFESADAGRVDELQPAAEDLAREHHLGRHDAALVARVAALRHIVGELIERHLASLHRGSRGPRGALRLHEHPGRRLLGVRHRGGHAGGDVVVDRAGRRVDEGVDELALALLELSDHDHADAGITQPRPGLLESLGEIGAADRRGERPEVVHDLRDRGRLR